MDIKTNALCVRALDYRDNDKLLTLCTIERGKILAKITGCKSPKSKLRFAASPLCFGEYILAEKGGRYTVTGCTPYDNFYEISNDLQKYYAAFTVLECTERLSTEGGDCENCRLLVMLAVNSLKELCYGASDPKAEIIKYFTDVLACIGYGLSFDGCALSGQPLEGQVYFDFISGGIVNKFNRTADSIPLSPEGLGYLQGRAEGAPFSVLKEVTAFLVQIVSRQAGVKLNTASVFLDLT